jgi:hypothetical protein
MTGDTTDTFVEVNTVVKIDKIWQVVHSGPDQRLPGAETLPYRRKKRALSPDISMTVHTRLSGWEPGKGAHLY